MSGRPTVLLDLATVRLVERKVLLPGVSVPARLIAQVRDRASARLWRALPALPDAMRDQYNGLVAALEIAFDRPIDHDGSDR